MDSNLLTMGSTPLSPSRLAMNAPTIIPCDSLPPPPASTTRKRIVMEEDEDFFMGGKVDEEEERMMGVASRSSTEGNASIHAQSSEKEETRLASAEPVESEVNMDMDVDVPQPAPTENGEGKKKSRLVLELDDGFEADEDLTPAARLEAATTSAAIAEQG